MKRRQSIDDQDTELQHNKDKQIEDLLKEKEKLEIDYNNLDTSKLQLECDVIALKNDLELINERNDSLENELKLKTNEIDLFKQKLNDQSEETNTLKTIIETQLNEKNNNSNLNLQNNDLKLLKLG